MHKWEKNNHSTVILCNECSRKKYKSLVIRVDWKKKDLDRKHRCDNCGATTKISLNSKD